MSGVTVATTMRSISSAPIPRRRSASWAASAAMTLVGVPGSTTWRFWMPVRVRIHSSVVSTIFSRSAFVTTRSGTCVPRAVIAARLWLMRLSSSGPPASSGRHAGKAIRILDPSQPKGSSRPGAHEARAASMAAR